MDVVLLGKRPGPPAAREHEPEEEANDHNAEGGKPDSPAGNAARDANP